MSTSHSDTLTLACELIARDSTTPDDAGCQQLMGQRQQATYATMPQAAGEQAETTGDRQLALHTGDVLR